MAVRRQDESLEQFAIRSAFEYGHFWSPDNPDGANVRQQDLPKLRATDPVVVQALISMAKANAGEYTRATLQRYGELPHFDGLVDSAMADLLEVSRCPVPDYAPPPGVVFQFDDPWVQEVVTTMQSRAAEPALGVGNWKECHGTNGIHCTTVMINAARQPDFLKPVFPELLKRVQSAFAGIGLLMRFMDQNKKDLLTGETLNTNVNIDVSWENASSGWIGLAIVGTNQSCSDRIWAKFLATYRGGNSNEQILTQWTTLKKHEFIHNCGFSHTNGGVMNPSIVNGLPTEFQESDPITPKLKQSFSGVPVQIPGGPETPPPTPVPPVDSVEKAIRELQLKNAVQDAHLAWLTERVRQLSGGR